MYKEIYSIPFKSIKENSYRISIEKKGYKGESTEIDGGNRPIIIHSNNDNLLIPYNLSSGTLRLFGGDYLQELFTPDPQGVRVTLYKNNQLEWNGFVLNDVYNQDYTNDKFIYEIELVNPLATLKHIKFDLNVGLITFTELIKYIINKTNSKLRYFLSPVTNTTSPDGQRINDNLRVSCSNFYDEQDEPMKLYDVLLEIGKFNSYTIHTHKDSVYFVDFYGLSKNFKFFDKYDITGVNNTVRVLKSHHTTIQELNYANDEHSLSIKSGKNKIKIKCSLFDINNLIPEFNDEKSKFIEMKESESTSNKITYKEIRRFYETENFTMFEYDNHANNMVEHNGGVPSWKLGSYLMRSDNYDIDNKPVGLNMATELLVKTLEIASPGRLTKEHPVIKFKSRKKITINPLTHFLITADVMVNSQLFNKNVASELIKIDEKKDNTVYMYAQMKVGNYYYDGEFWTQSNVKFKMPITIEKNNKLNETYLTLDNSNTFEKGIGEREGYLFKAPDNLLLDDMIELTFYAFDGYRQLHPYGTPGDYYLRYRNLGLYAGIPTSDIYDDWVDEDSMNDAVYEGEISDDYVDEMEDINLKLCTHPQDYPKLTYSSVYHNDDYLKEVQYLPINDNLISEELIITKAIELNNKQRYKLDVGVENNEIYPYSIVSDNNLNNVEFIKVGEEIDYEYEVNNIQLLQIN